MKYMLIPLLILFLMILNLSSQAVLVFQSHSTDAAGMKTLECTYFTGRSIKTKTFNAAAGKSSCDFNIQTPK